MGQRLRSRTVRTEQAHLIFLDLSSYMDIQKDLDLPRSAQMVLGLLVQYSHRLPVRLHTLLLESLTRTMTRELLMH